MQTPTQTIMQPTVRKKKRPISEVIKPYLFIAPNFLGFTLFILIPILYSLAVSFMDFSIFKGFAGAEFVGLDNYTEMLSDPGFSNALANNIIYALGTIPIMMILAVILASVLNKGVYLSRLMRAMFFLPYITSVVAIAEIWKMIFNPSQGILNRFLMELGIENVPGWLGDMQWALPAITIVGIWIGLGYNMVIYLAGLQGIPLELYESARIDGASTVQIFWHITIPQLQSTTFFLLITNIINSFQVFGLINIMTEGGPGEATEVLAHYIYMNGFRFNKMGYASAMGIFLFALIFVITLFQWRMQKKYEDSQ